MLFPTSFEIKYKKLSLSKDFQYKLISRLNRVYNNSHVYKTWRIILFF